MPPHGAGRTASPVPFRERRRRSGASADVVVYTLAGLVLAASAVALFLLLRAG